MASKNGQMENYQVIAREGGIPLDEWLSHVSRSSVLELAPSRQGINPFTRQPTVFKPAAGAASFQNNSGRCSIEYKSGELIVFAMGADAMPILMEIARSLGANIRPV